MYRHFLWPPPLPFFSLTNFFYVRFLISSSSLFNFSLCLLAAECDTFKAFTHEGRVDPAGEHKFTVTFERFSRFISKPLALLIYDLNMNVSANQPVKAAANHSNRQQVIVLVELLRFISLWKPERKSTVLLADITSWVKHDPPSPTVCKGFNLWLFVAVKHEVFRASTSLIWPPSPAWWEDQTRSLKAARCLHVKGSVCSRFIHVSKPLRPPFLVFRFPPTMVVMEVVATALWGETGSAATDFLH